MTTVLDNFYVGQKVMKVTGDYRISGIIRSIFLTGSNQIRMVVEHKAEGGGSFLHIYAPKNLEPIDD